MSPSATPTYAVTITAAPGQSIEQALIDYVVRTVEPEALLLAFGRVHNYFGDPKDDAVLITNGAAYLMKGAVPERQHWVASRYSFEACSSRGLVERGLQALKSEQWWDEHDRRVKEGA